MKKNEKESLLHLDIETAINELIDKKNSKEPVWTLIDDSNSKYTVWHKHTLLDNGYNECFDKGVNPNNVCSKHNELNTFREQIHDL